MKSSIQPFEKYQKWEVHISPKLTEAEYAEGKVNELLKDNPKVIYSEDLHLGVSLRSYRAEKVSAFVHALLSFDESASTFYEEIKDKYPIVLTRDMEKARKWLHDKVRGTEPSRRYWFPESTVYIGNYPDIPDKGKHEFPSYTMILGDLHAHYTGLIFTVSVIALAAACLLNRENTSGKKQMILCSMIA